MARNTRAITPEDLAKVAALHRGEIQLPAYITAWNQKVAEAESILVSAMVAGTISDSDKYRCRDALVKMKMRKDHLYNVWLQDLPFKTWDDLANERPPAREDLYTYTVLDTEDFLNGPGVSAFVFFLNERWPGIFKEFAHALLRDCDPLIEESIALTPEIRRAFAYPKEVFGTDNTEILEARVLAWARKIYPEDAPAYVQRLFSANLMVAFGNEMGACTEMEFARSEAVEPEFQKLIERPDQRINTLLDQTQWWEIDMLLSLWPSD